MLAGGGEHVSDLDILRTGAGVFGKVASKATVSRFFKRTVTNPDVFTYGFATLTRTNLARRCGEAKLMEFCLLLMFERVTQIL